MDGTQHDIDADLCNEILISALFRDLQELHPFAPLQASDSRFHQISAECCCQCVFCIFVQRAETLKVNFKLFQQVWQQMTTVGHIRNLLKLDEVVNSPLGVIWKNRRNLLWERFIINSAMSFVCPLSVLVPDLLTLFASKWFSDHRFSWSSSPRALLPQLPHR